MSQDVARLLDVLRALGARTEIPAAAVLIPGEPHRKMRPKFSRRGRHTVTYQPAEDEAAEKRTARVLRAAIKQPLVGNVALAAIFYRSDRQVIDTDNLIKHVCDAGNGILFLDDSQATATAGIIELDADNPRTLLMIAAHRSTMQRGADHGKGCPACGQWFSLEGKSASTRFCSQACSAIGRRKDFTPLEVST